MAFNFNWSPLIADTVRAREMLTTALNKSPKPPIIVDDIVVTELNLGKVPPDLEILEIGDLAEDRFRGIFKMTYSGDAFLTLKTRVQANPLNTYLSTKPSFASPQPLAASSGLTIPLQITLSDIRLSGFVILVFSRQKGLTLVFRNDPLESLKVSSTFDSIQFVRDYLQKEIEGQLRVLFTEDLPAILHKLSLRLWSPDYCDPDDIALLSKKDDTTIPIDPLASPPQDPVDWLSSTFDDGSVPSLALNAPAETHSNFSQKNIIRLAALSDCHRTLSLFTPSIRDAVFRTWAGFNDRGSGTHTPSVGNHSRLQTSLGSASSIYSGGVESEPSTRPTFSSSSSYPYSRSSSNNNSSSNSGRARSHGQRKRKPRVIDFRRHKEPQEAEDGIAETNSALEPSLLPSSAPSVMLEDELQAEQTAPRSPSKVRFSGQRPQAVDEMTPTSIRSVSRQPSMTWQKDSEQGTPLQQQQQQQAPPAYGLIDLPAGSSPAGKSLSLSKRPSRSSLRSAERPLVQQQRRMAPLSTVPSSSTIPLLRSLSGEKVASASGGSTGGILEQAWLLKMAREIARKVEQEKEREELQLQRSRLRAEREKSKTQEKATITNREKRAAAVAAAAAEGLLMTEDEAPPAYTY